MRGAVVAFLASSLLSAAATAIAIPLLKRLKFGQNILVYVKEHDYKKGTPTMGGIAFILTAVAVFFWSARGRKSLSCACAAIGIAYMLVGTLDDFTKIKAKRNKGLSPWQKAAFELAIAVVVSIFAYSRGMTKTFIPFFGGTIDFGVAYIPFCSLVFLSATNGVNLTDGLDGLAGEVSLVFFLALAAIVKVETVKYSGYYANVSEYENLATLCLCLSGAIFGFLLFNSHKASVFMGDAGSLSVGGFAASIALFSGNALFIPFLGITFVASSISVIMQIAHFRRTGERLFLIAPLHHHFQHKGYDEGKIAFWYKFVTVTISLLLLAFYM